MSIVSCGWTTYTPLPSFPGFSTMKSHSTLPKKNTPKRSKSNPKRPAAQGSPFAKKSGFKFIQEVFDSILWRIDAKYSKNETMLVGLTGCTRKSGTSTIAANLAMRASSQQRGRVLLVDANWGGSNLPKAFQIEPGPGLYDILSGEVSPRECEPIEVAENLDVLRSGKLEKAGAVHVRHQLVEAMLADLKTDYSLILVDLPFAKELRSALPLARQLDGVLLVTRFETVKQKQAQSILQQLEQDGIEVWGSVLNRRRNYLPQWLQNLL